MMGSISDWIWGVTGVLLEGIPQWMAYVGPGPGLSFLSSLIGLLGAIGTSLLLVILLPLRRWMKRRQKQEGSGSE